MNVRKLTAATAMFGIAGTLAVGCTNRPVVPGEPTLKTNFTAQVQEQAIDKIDILFMIDNSASMGDKQVFLQQAVPALITRLVTPNCVASDGSGTVVGASTTTGTTDGICPANSAVEFPPVHDLHLGIVSSSLGTRGGDLCDPTAVPSAPYGNISDHNDDQGHLLSRSLTVTTTSATEGVVADANTTPDNYLYWFPGVTENSGKTPGKGTAITASAQLVSDFQSLVTGVGFFGCGIESQLESWYRFLIQPDPYNDIKLVTNGNNQQATWDGVDATIIAQRHDFLRPDSLVAIITLTDENDSEIDVRSVSGSAYNFMVRGFQPPRGTVPCNTNPADPNCTSCDFLSAAAQAADANCSNAGGVYPSTVLNDWGYDPNLRHVHMKGKYGVDPQFPITRYVNGLTSTKVPDRTGEYPNPNNSYAGNNDCQNPLFAASLPDGTATDAKTLCNLPAGPRTKDLVFFAHIGGVPNKLLHFDPNSAANSLLTDADWVSILGTDPDNFNYAGIDPHMIESYSPRQPLAQYTPTALDPVNGYDWDTSNGTGHVLNVDREYACTFPLATPRDCTQAYNSNACDCPVAPTLTNTGGDNQIPSVCDLSNLPNSQTSQIGAKAYPTIRELNLAHKMGTQGIVSSICPIKTTGATDDPEYGYNPAIAVLVDRLKNALTSQCLPQSLTANPTGTCIANGSQVCTTDADCGGAANSCQKGYPCLILATLPNPGAPCNPKLGLSTPDPGVLATFQANQEAAWNNAGGKSSGQPDPATLTVCSVNQLSGNALVNGSCKGSTSPGWCYVTGAAAGTCPQAILFGGGAPPTGSQISLQCIEANTAGADGG